MEYLHIFFRNLFVFDSHLQKSNFFKNRGARFFFFLCIIMIGSFCVLASLFGLLRRLALERREVAGNVALHRLAQQQIADHADFVGALPLHALEQRAAQQQLGARARIRRNLLQMENNSKWK